MSKIEKALERAQREKGRPLAPVDEQRANAGSMASGPESPRTTIRGEAGQQLLGHVNESIAKMRDQQLRTVEELSSNRIIHAGMKDGSTMQAFRDLRTKLMQRFRDQNGIVMVTSAVASGGGTFVSMNLGAAIAFDTGKTALLVDCNLGKPWMQGLFRDKSAHGLTDYLNDPEMDASTIIHSVGINRLRVVTAGTQSRMPGEYFTSTRMQQLLESMRRRYRERYIILDAPPMSELADAQTLMDLCDYVILVVPYGRVTGSQLDACISGIDSKKLLGIVFNNEPTVPEVEWSALPRRGFYRVLDILTQLRSTAVRNLTLFKSKPSA